MTGILRPCIEQVGVGICGRLIPADSGWNRCELHRKGHSRAGNRLSAAARGYGSEHQRLRKRVLREHLAKHGLTCPGWLVPKHAVSHSSQLQADHVVPLADGGSADDTNLQILCARCNRRKGAASTIAPIGSRTVNEPAQSPQPPKPEPRVFIR